MKYLSFVLFVNFFIMLNGYSAITRPTKCIYGHGGTNGQERFEWCSEMNPKLDKKIGGVCIFNDDKNIWTKGTWVPSKEGKARFVLSRICDKGIEFASADDTTAIAGPKLFVDKLVDTEKANITSRFKPTDDLFKDKLPTLCYTGQDSTSGASRNPVLCSSDILEPNFCELKELSKVGRHKRSFNGHWWVQYPNAKKRDFTICIGGVVLEKANNQDPDYEIVDNIAPLQGHEAKFCLRNMDNGKTSNLTEIRCEDGPGTAIIVNSCYLIKPTISLRLYQQEIFDHVLKTNPDELVKYIVKKTRAGFDGATIGDKKYNISKLAREWEPEDEADEVMLKASKEKLESSKVWVQVLKVDKAGDGTDQLICKKVKVVKPRDL